MSGAEKIVFVGGAPRSGTTVTHALICTAQGVSAYSPEISFFRGLVSAYRLGRAAWEGHTKAFFDTPEAFRLFMREVTDLALQRIWEALDRPEILALKDPMLTPFFPELRLLYPDRAWFVAVGRDPVDVVRSRQAVQEKQSPDRPFTEADATGLAREYVGMYRAVFGPDYGDRLLFLRYEHLNDAALQARLADFIGVSSLDPARLWGGQPDTAPDDPWGSPKYHRPIDLEPRLSPLDPDWAAKVRAICAPIMARAGYG